MSYRPLAHIVPHLPRVARRGNLITHKPFILITDRERRHARPPYDHSDKTDHHPWFKPRGGVLSPIGASDVRHPPEGVDEYRHGLWQRVNAASVAAFSAVGHGIIDDVEMLGRRQDAHPGSHNGEGDTVHYCLPGPIDYALDEVIRVLRRSFDQAPRFYGV